MKKIIITLAAVAAAFTTASCSKEPFVEQEENTALGNCIITASTESNLTKTSLYGNDTDGYEVVWSEGDTFKLRGETFTLIKGAGTTSGTFQGYVSPLNGAATAYYPASYDGSNWPTEQTYTKDNITGSPMKADVRCWKGEIDGGKIEFKNVGGILRLTVKGSEKIKSIKVFADGLKDITLNCGDGVALDGMNGTVFHIAMPEGKYSGVSIMFTSVSDDCIIKTLKADTQLVINPSEITTASFKVSTAPNGALPGSFSVAEGKQVYFSKGNLWTNYEKDRDAEAFHFESNQWGYREEFTFTHISHFCWSQDYRGAISGGLNSDHTLFCDESHKVSVDGSEQIYYVLSEEEWEYLFDGRTMVNGKDSYTPGITYGGKRGVVLYPDDYNGPTLNPNTEYTDETFPIDCVFLPAAGYRESNDIHDDHIGYYWTSSPNIEHDVFSGYAFYVPFDGLDVLLGRQEKCSRGYSLRLVANASSSPAPTFTVTFDINGKTGMAPADITGVQYHSTINEPEKPTDKNCLFDGWYRESSCTNKWDFEKDAVTKDITLYANWIELPDGVLSGMFTVADGKQVHFSQGNLYYDGSFKFESKQYEFHGYDTGVAWGLFGWSTSATNYGKKTSIKNSDYSGDFVEWGSQIDGTWHTLTCDEWTYLFSTRADADKKYGCAKVGGKEGLIILPDEFTDPMKNGGSNAFAPGTATGYNANVYGVGGNWESMEAAGAVFLPAAGRRSGESIMYVGDYGFYWSSSASGTDNAYYVEFSGSSVKPAVASNRFFGCSVRLVTNVTE